MLKTIKTPLKIIMLLSLSTISLHPDIINQLSNKKLSISGYFFSSSKSLYFLRYTNENNSSLWEYTKQRKFKPIHNTKSFDGYDKADKLFKNIKIDNNNTVVISDIIKNTSSNLHKDIINKTFTPTHLLLKNKDSNNKSSYNVLTNKNATSLWEYKNRKYRPIHNAKSFDGYEEAKKIFTNMSIAKDNLIHIGDIDKVNYSSFKTKEYSLNNAKPMKIVKPSDYKNNYIQLTPNLIKDKANELIWQNNKDNAHKTYEQSKHYCENLSIDGYSGFRLPNGLEAFSLFSKKVDNKQIFNISNSMYWSSYKEETVNYMNKASEKSAYVFRIDDTSESSVEYFAFQDYGTARTKCVRGDITVSPILIRNNKLNVVLDVSNGIVWQDTIDIRKSVTIKESLTYCDDLTIGNYTNWRLPNTRELSMFIHQQNIDYFQNFHFYSTYLPDDISINAYREIIKYTDNIRNIYGPYVWEKIKKDTTINTKSENLIYDYLFKNLDTSTIKEILNSKFFTGELNSQLSEKKDNINSYINMLKNLKEIPDEILESYINGDKNVTQNIMWHTIRAIPVKAGSTNWKLSFNMVFPNFKYYITSRQEILINKYGYNNDLLTKNDSIKKIESLKQELQDIEAGKYSKLFKNKTLYSLLFPYHPDKYTTSKTLDNFYQNISIDMVQSKKRFPDQEFYHLNKTNKICLHDNL